MTGRSFSSRTPPPVDYSRRNPPNPSLFYVPTCVKLARLKGNSPPAHLATSIPPGKKPPGLCLRSNRIDCAPSSTVRSIAALFSEIANPRPNAEKEKRRGGRAGGRAGARREVGTG